MSLRRIWKAIRNATSLPGSGFGATPCASLDGPTTGPSGRGVAPASHSARRAKAKEPQTPATCGLSGSGSSASVALSQCLGSRLEQRFATAGSTLFRQTWKVLVTPSGRQLWAHTASARHAIDLDCSGWQTPRARGDAGGTRWKNGEARNLEDQARMYGLMRGLTVSEVARLSLSPTFCRRLMGLLEEWDACAPTATRSSRRSRPSS